MWTHITVTYFTSIEILMVTWLPMYHSCKGRIWTQLEAGRSAHMLHLTGPMLPPQNPVLTQVLIIFLSQLWEDARLQQTQKNRKETTIPFLIVPVMGESYRHPMQLWIRDFWTPWFFIPMVQNVNSGTDWLCPPTV